jgi:hypothetical protein
VTPQGNALLYVERKRLRVTRRRNLENRNEYRKERSGHVWHFESPKDLKPQAPHVSDRFDIAKNAKPVPTVTEKVLILEPARVIQTTVARKAKVVNLEADGVVRATHCPQGRRWMKG